MSEKVVLATKRIIGERKSCFDDQENHLVSEIIVW